eukprot:6732508-Pyramimonas_sp.AAC.2
MVPRAQGGWAAGRRCDICVTRSLSSGQAACHMCNTVALFWPDGVAGLWAAAGGGVSVISVGLLLFIVLPTRGCRPRLQPPPAPPGACYTYVTPPGQRRATVLHKCHTT